MFALGRELVSSSIQPPPRRPKKALVASFVLVLAVACVGAWEWLWRVEHGSLSTSVLSPSGVYVRNRSLPLQSTSTLLFAGYCKPGMRAYWRSEKEIAVACTVAEGTPVAVANHQGIDVTTASGP
jgi:hypothetical protein